MIDRPLLEPFDADRFAAMATRRSSIHIAPGWAIGHRPGLGWQVYACGICVGYRMTREVRYFGSGAEAWAWVRDMSDADLNLIS